MRWSALLLCAACGGGGTELEAPEFHFFVRQGDGVPLVDLRFENFAAASMTGPYDVTVVEGSRMRTLSVDVNFCSTYECTGHLSYEQIVLTSDPSDVDGVIGFSCMGVSGTFYAGVDSGGTGDCAE